MMCVLFFRPDEKSGVGSRGVSEEPGVSKGLALWSEKEEKNRAAKPWDPIPLPKSPRGPGVSLGEVGSCLAASISGESQKLPY